MVGPEKINSGVSLQSLIFGVTGGGVHTLCFFVFCRAVGEDITASAVPNINVEEVCFDFLFGDRNTTGTDGDTQLPRWLELRRVVGQGEAVATISNIDAEGMHIGYLDGVSGVSDPSSIAIEVSLRTILWWL